MKKFLLFTIGFILNIATMTVNAEDWLRIGEFNFIDKSAIVSEDNTNFSFVMKSFNKGQYEPIRNIPVRYTLIQYQINCETNSYKLGIIDSYDENDNFLYGDYNKFANYQPIINQTSVYEASKYLCKI